jgi:DNA invertase Pin-like site-specific DNA recombinase
LSSSTVSAQFSSPLQPLDELLQGGDGQEFTAGYARYSSHNQNEASNAQQFSGMYVKAASNRHTIPPDLHFQDNAVSGRKRNRKGLNALLEAARQARFKVIYLWDISRLAREMVIGLPIIKDLVHNYGIRIISVSDGIDTNNSSWEAVIVMHSLLAQEKIKRLIEDVRRGHQDNVKDNNSNGDHCFGFNSVIAPGAINSSRARKLRPKKIIQIDPVAADWVRRIFHWYLDEDRSLYWIAKELNKLKAPRDHRSTSAKGWTTTCVAHVIDNPKYIGLWPYGKRKNKCNPLTGDVSIELRSEGDIDYSVTERPDLRIIEHDLFYKAKKKREEHLLKLAPMREKNGRLRGSFRDLQNPRHMLQGLMKCGKCDRTLTMNGLRGNYLQCSGYPSRQCDAKTSLLRKYTEQQIVTYLQGILRNREDLRARLFQAVTEAWNTQLVQQPQERLALEQRRNEVKKRMNAILDFIENGEKAPELSALLSTRRRELEEIQSQLDILHRDQQPTKPPTQEWIIEKLEKMHQLLEGDPRRAGVAIRQLIGTITVREVDIPGLKRKKLVGTFYLNPGQLAVGVLGVKETLFQGEAEEVTLTFAELPIWARRADEIKALYDQNLSAFDIAEKLGLKFGAIAKALKWWYSQRGTDVPSGSEKRARIMRPTPIQDSVMADVIRLYVAGMPLRDISKQAGCSRCSVTVIIKKWHQEQGTPWLHGKTRQKQVRLDRESKLDQDAA